MEYLFVFAVVLVVGGMVALKVAERSKRRTHGQGTPPASSGGRRRRRRKRQRK